MSPNQFLGGVHNSSSQGRDKTSGEGLRQHASTVRYTVYRIPYTVLYFDHVSYVACSLPRGIYVNIPPKCWLVPGSAR